MFDVGFSELLVIALVGLIVLGPKRLPEVARTAGQWVARFRRFVSDVKQDFDRELQRADLGELQQLKQELDETRRMMQETSSQLMQQAKIEPSFEPVPSQSAAPSPSIAPPLAEPAPSSDSKTRRSSKRSKKAVTSEGKHGRSG